MRVHDNNNKSEEDKKRFWKTRVIKSLVAGACVIVMVALATKLTEILSSPREKERSQKNDSSEDEDVEDDPSKTSVNMLKGGITACDSSDHLTAWKGEGYRPIKTNTKNKRKTNQTDVVWYPTKDERTEAVKALRSLYYADDCCGKKGCDESLSYNVCVDDLIRHANAISMIKKDKRCVAMIAMEYHANCTSIIQLPSGDSLIVCYLWFILAEKGCGYRGLLQLETELKSDRVFLDELRKKKCKGFLLELDSSTPANTKKYLKWGFTKHNEGEGVVSGKYDDCDCSMYKIVRIS